MPETQAPNIFYYRTRKYVADMTDDELVDEILAAYGAAQHARATGQGINTKESVRRRDSEMELVKRPGGIDRWNFECLPHRPE